MYRLSPSHAARAAVVLALGLAAGSCATNPATGKKMFSLVSEGQEIQMGQQYAQQVSTEMGVFPDSALQAYVAGIGLRLARASERPQLPWTFTVMDDPQVNAFALPGGPIFVTRGILAHMNSEAELASVLGHEIGHVTARHSVQQMSKQQLAQIGLVAGSILSKDVAKNVGLLSQGLGVLFLKYSRDDETQADGLGFRYALNDGYDVRKMIDMFLILQRVTAQAGARVPEWQSTHPDPGNRIQATQQRIARVTVPLDGTRVLHDEFVRRLDGMIYGDDPRQGFFRSGVFYHPDLAFQLEFPAGWQTVNQPQAVVGGSPKQDAQLQLKLAGKGAPDQAMQQFAGQQGVQAGQASRSPINGNPASLAEFTAQSQDGSALHGLVAFVSYGGNTYQLLGLSTEVAYRQYDATFRRFVGSFRRTADPAVLGVKPNRLSLVKLGTGMTLVQFNQKNPSVIPMGQLALINGLADSTAQLAAGSLVKRVVAGK